MRPVDESVRERVRLLIGQGMGRNEVAREAGCSGATVTKIAQEEGLSFDRAATAQAVDARRRDLADRRTAIIERLYARAETVLDRLEAETYSYWIPVPGKGAELVTADEPPARDEKDLAGAIASYLSQAVKLEDVDSGASVDAGKTLLGALFDGIRSVADALDGDAPDEEDGATDG